MLQISWSQIILIGIPEMLVIIFGIYLITKQPFNLRNYIFSSVAMAVLVFFVRMLPINYGVHTIISIILNITLMVFVGIPIRKSIYGTLLMYLILSLCEVLDVALLSALNFNMNLQSASTLEKFILTIPSLVLFVIFIAIIYYILKFKEKSKVVS